MIFKPVERLLAFRYLSPAGKRGLSLLLRGFLAGITLGVATPIIVMSVMNGFRTELINRILGLNGHIGVFSATSEPLTDYNRAALKLAELPNVIAATPQVQGQGDGQFSPRPGQGQCCAGFLGSILLLASRSGIV